MPLVCDVTFSSSQPNPEALVHHQFYADRIAHRHKLAQALVAFGQNPTPSLARSIAQLRAALKYQERRA
jgi:hypothetical protein